MNYENRNYLKLFDTLENGFSASNFHYFFDNKNDVLVLIETTDNERFGGFNSLSFGNTGYK